MSADLVHRAVHLEHLAKLGRRVEQLLGSTAPRASMDYQHSTRRARQLASEALSYAQAQRGRLGGVP